MQFLFKLSQNSCLLLTYIISYTYHCHSAMSNNSLSSDVSKQSATPLLAQSKGWLVSQKKTPMNIAAPEYTTALFARLSLAASVSSRTFGIALFPWHLERIRLCLFGCLPRYLERIRFCVKHPMIVSHGQRYQTEILLSRYCRRHKIEHTPCHLSHCMPLTCFLNDWQVDLPSQCKHLTDFLLLRNI
jgi:hypothetical protein